MLSMALMEDMVLGTVLMVMEILATLLLVMALDMALMDMESVKLKPSQRLMLMLSMALMEDMVLGPALILQDMVMDILVMAMDLVLAMALMDMENVTLMLNQSPMLSMEPMAGMAMDLDTVLTPWDMDMDMAMD